MTPLSSSHFCSHFLLKIGHNCFSSRIALPSHHFYNQTFFPTLTDVLIPLSPKSVYPFPYCLQPGRQVVPYPCGEGWVRLNVSTFQRTAAGEDTNTMHDKSPRVSWCVMFYSTEQWPLTLSPLSQRLPAACPVLTDTLWNPLLEETPIPGSSKGHMRLLLLPPISLTWLQSQGFDCWVNYLFFGWWKQAKCLLSTAITPIRRRRGERAAPIKLHPKTATFQFLHLSRRAV